MEAIFSKIINYICKTSKFSFTLNRFLALDISYNQGNGSARVILDKSMLGVYDFLQVLVNHPNKLKGEIAPQALEALPAPEKEDESGFYFNVTKRKFYFDVQTSELFNSQSLDWTNPHLRYGYEVEHNVIPGYTVIWHPGIGYDISIVYNGHLYDIAEYQGTKDEKIAAFFSDLLSFDSTAEMVQALEDADD